MVIRSLRNRLAMLFGLIVLGAIAVVYLSIVPQLEGQLRDQKIASLAEVARIHVRPVLQTVGRDVSQEAVRTRVTRAAARAGARVTVLDVASGTEGQGLSISVDSQAQPDPEDTRFAVAEEAARTGREARGTEPTNAGRIAEVAIPVTNGTEVGKVVVFSDGLEAVTENVEFIRRQLLVWGGIALVVAILLGYLVAKALSDRVRRLEAAARRVAGGDFSSRIEADADDELGRLAAAFDDMQRQLARLHSAREQFIATASHELRTPIFSLGGFLELIADEELDDETRRQFVDQVRGQVDRLRKLSTELLDLSRLEAGALELRPEPTDLAALAKEVTAEFTPAVQRHRANVSVDVSDGIEVEVDPERVAQVLRILMDNALVHTPPGTGITVSAERVDGEVRLAVTDTGRGIKRQTMPHIFEPFFTSNDDAQGAGLGLAIASELAGHMQGQLLARSTSGGTTFTLVLPV